MPEPNDLTTLLERLVASGVEFILVGGLAAVAQGAPISTFDTTINARDRHRTGPPIAISPATLTGPGHSLLMTDLGPLDVLGAIEEGMTYDDLERESREVELEGARLRVLSLETIVRLKRPSSDNKDKLRLPVLEEALRRSKTTRS
jgi:hypothetical protein